MEEKRVCASRQ